MGSGGTTTSSWSPPIWTSARAGIPGGTCGIQGCAGFGGGAIVARGRSFTVSQTAVKPWLAALNEVEAIADLGPRWSLDVSLGLLFPLQRMSLVVSSPSGRGGARAQCGPVGEFVGLGVIIVFSRPRIEGIRHCP